MKTVVYLLLMTICTGLATGSQDSTRVVDVCGGDAVIDAGEEIYLVSPNKVGETERDATPYARLLECHLVLSGSSNTSNASGSSVGSMRVELEVLDLESEVDGQCYDSLTMDSGERTAAQYCGYLFGTSECIVGEQVTFHLSTDNYGETADNHMGFRLRISAHEGNICQCTAANGEPCIFPFTDSDSKTYHQCAGGLEPFCATEVDDDGVITEAGRQPCNMNLEACQQKCLTTTGEQCLFPFPYSGVLVHSCITAERGGDHLCTTRALRDPSTISVVDRGVCMPEQCSQMPACGSSVDLDMMGRGQFSSKGSMPVASNIAYQVGDSCLLNFSSQAQQSSLVSLDLLSVSIWCPDHVRVAFWFEGQSIEYKVCGDYRVTGQDLNLCLLSTHFEVQFVAEQGKPDTAPDNARRSGFNADYQLGSECGNFSSGDSVQRDAACTSPEAREVTEATTIHSYLSPLPYPSNTTCRWVIDASSHDPAAIIKVTPNHKRLGDPQNDGVATTDAIQFQEGERTPQIWSSENPDDVMAFISIGPMAELRFTSGEFFNGHSTFELEVSFTTMEDDLDLLVSRGFCIDETRSDACKFPFSLGGSLYDGCTSRHDTRYWCLNASQQKMYCDMALASCLVHSPRVLDLNMTWVSERSVTFQWIVDFDNWDWFELVLTDTTDDAETTMTVEGLSATVNDLTPDTRYVVRIVPINDGVEGSFRQISFSTGDTKLSWMDTASGETVLSWDPDVIPVDGSGSYSISLRPSEGNFLIDSTNPGDWIAHTSQSSESTIDGITPGVVYDMEINNYRTQFATPPNAIPANTARISTNTEYQLILQGTLGEETLMQEIRIEVDYRGSRQRRSVGAPVLCSLEDGCISDTGDFTVVVGDSSSTETVVVSLVGASLGLVSEATQVEFSVVQGISVSEVTPFGVVLEVTVDDADVESVAIRLESREFVNSTGRSGSIFSATFDIQELSPSTDYVAQITLHHIHSANRIDTETAFSFTTEAIPQLQSRQNPQIDNPVTMFEVTFTHLPFGEDPTIVQYTILIRPPTEEPYYTMPLTPYPPVVSENSTWTVLVGSGSCEGNTFCDGPLDPDTEYRLIIEGRKANGDQVFSDIQGPFRTELGPKAVSDITLDTRLKSITAIFEHSQRNETVYTGTLSGQTIVVSGNSCAPNCSMKFINLGVSRSYSLRITTSFFGLENSYSQRVSTEGFTTLDMTLVASLRDTIDLQLNGPPFGDDGDVEQFTLAIGDVGQQIPETPSKLHTWQEVYHHGNATSGFAVYQAFQGLDYPPSEETPNIIYQGEGRFRIIMGSDAYCLVSPGSMCNGPLEPGRFYNLWFVAFMTDDMTLYRGPFGPFGTAGNSNNEKMIGNLSVTEFILMVAIVGIIFLILVLFLALSLVTYARRLFSRRRKKERAGRYRPTTSTINVSGDLVEEDFVMEPAGSSSAPSEPRRPPQNIPRPVDSEGTKKPAVKTWVYGDMMEDDNFLDINAIPPSYQGFTMNPAYVATEEDGF